MPICSITPSCITTMRSAIVIASIWSWVTYTVVVLNRWWLSLISERMATRSLASRFESGSSNRNTRGWRTMARPIATRWRWPPESCFGKRASRLSSPSIPAAAPTRCCIVAFGARASRSEKPMLSATVMCG